MEISSAILKVYLPPFKPWKKASRAGREELKTGALNEIERIGRKLDFSVVVETDDTTSTPWIEFVGVGWTGESAERAFEKTSMPVRVLEIISVSEAAFNSGGRPTSTIKLVSTRLPSGALQIQSVPR